MHRYKEQINRIEAFIDDCVKRVNKLNPSKKTVFTISSTATKKDNISLGPYTTPIRDFANYSITGCVVYTQGQALAALQAINDIVDIVLVDSEKKIPILVDPEISFLSDELRSITTGDDKIFSNVETGNLSSVCYEYCKDREIYSYKANDLTVDSVFGFILNDNTKIEKSKISIIGAGNIGTKLALKFAEVGANVIISRQDHSKGRQITEALNLIKPSSTISEITYCDNILKACFKSDYIIGTTDSSIINWEHILISNKNVQLIDVGKGAFTKDAIENSIKNNIKITRTDITPALEGHLEFLIKQKEYLLNNTGRNKINGMVLVSGGVLGGYEDIVVDNCYTPKCIVGLSDGCGDIIRNPNKEQRDLLDKVKDFTL